MGKRSRKEGEVSESKKESISKPSILADEKAVDPSLALLFSSSAGPVKAPPKSRYEEPPPAPRRQNAEESNEDDEEEDDTGPLDDDDEDLSSVDVDLEEFDLEGLSGEEGEDDFEAVSDTDSDELVLDRIIEAANPKPDRKRKRKPQEEDLEGKYMQKLAKEEEKEEEERQTERRLKRQKILSDKGEDIEENGSDVDMDDAVSNEDIEVESEDERIKKSSFPSDVPVHESLAPSKDAVELEKASRTVFLANVSTLAISSKSAKKTLLAHMSSFLPSLPPPTEGKPPHKVESLRFRSTAYAGTSLPKKAAFVKKDLMAATTKSTNAYVVYSTAFAAREAVKKLNGTIVLERHLRVDGVAHPAKTDHRRCVFVGNLGFVDDESLLDQGGENERKRSKIPSDVEEGLWRQFNKAGTVESVRVVRDEKTRVGKGFAYVQFVDPNSVEAALLFNEKKYPPMLPRILRVVRAKAVRKTANAVAASRDDRRAPKGTPKNAIYNPKVTAEFSSLKGRASKLLGRAGAAQFNKKQGSGANETIVGKRGDGARTNGSIGGRAIEGIAKPPEAFVFEGFRASSKNGKPKDLKMGGKSSKKAGKPKNRGAKRASEWKKGGAKKTK